MFLLHSFQISNVVVVTVVVGVVVVVAVVALLDPICLNIVVIACKLLFVSNFNLQLSTFLTFFYFLCCSFFNPLLIKLGSYLYHSFLYLNGYCFYSYSQFLFSLHLVFLFNCCAYCLSWIIIVIRIPFHKLS